MKFILLLSDICSAEWIILGEFRIILRLFSSFHVDSGKHHVFFSQQLLYIVQKCMPAFQNIVCVFLADIFKIK